MKKTKLFLLLVLIMVVSYFLGPQPDHPSYKFELTQEFPSSISQIEDYIEDSNSTFNIREFNESQIIWADSLAVKTEYSIVYLHGFSASPGEGNPVNKEIAKEYGMNLYIPRLAHHGLVSDEPLVDFSASEFMNSAYEAIKLGELIGEKVIVMSCSTGSTASLFNIAESDVEVFAQVMYSPNIRLFDSKAPLLTMPWGLQIAQLVKGGDYNEWEVPAEASKYWYGKYRLEGVVELQNMLETSMTPSTFSKISVPTFIGYYYKDENNQDNVVSVSDIKDMITHLSVPQDKFEGHVFTEVGAHALQSEYFSKNIPSVIEQTQLFFENVLKIEKP